MTKEYFKLKQRYPDAILWFRDGDNYLAHKTDAQKTFALCKEVTLFDGVASFPSSALLENVSRAVNAGNKVAVCELQEEPKLRRGRKKK